MATSCYFAFLWTTKEGYDAMKGFFIGLGSAGGCILSSILVILGSCLPFQRISVHKIRQISSSRRRTGKKTGLTMTETGLTMTETNELYNPPSLKTLRHSGSKIPVCLSDYI